MPVEQMVYGDEVCALQVLGFSFRVVVAILNKESFVEKSLQLKDNFGGQLGPANVEW